MLRDQSELSGKPRGAGIALGNRRLVRGRRAPDRRDHAHRVEPLPVPGGDAVGPGSKPAPVQRREQHIAAAVTGKDAPGAVTAVCGRRQAGDQHARLVGTPAGNRPPQYGWDRNDRRLSAATCSRQATSLAQARQTDCLAASSARVPADAARARTAPTSAATGVAVVAGSSGQPLPGNTGPVTAPCRCPLATRRCHPGCRARWPPSR